MTKGERRERIYDPFRATETYDREIGVTAESKEEQLMISLGRVSSAIHHTKLSGKLYFRQTRGEKKQTNRNNDR